MTHTRESLIAFEQRVADAFLAKKIRAPVHLSGGNEDQLLEIFKEVRPQDWVFSTWRSHYHALLKGCPEEWVFAEILAGRSMYLMSREHRLLCSSIVGGILPIAAGVALGATRNGTGERVWVFVGDMTARTGLMHEFVQLCEGWNLPARVVVEDNGMSTNTPTEEAWGAESWYGQNWPFPLLRSWHNYTNTYPHVGVGKFVSF